MSSPQVPTYTPTAAQRARASAAWHGLSPLTDWGRWPGGVVNPVLLLNGHAVLRINVRNAEDPKVAKEAWVLDRLAGPMPRSRKHPQPHAADGAAPPGPRQGSS